MQHSPGEAILDAPSWPTLLQVQKYQELAAESINYNSRLADACYKDRMSFCANIQPVGDALGWRGGAHCVKHPPH